MKLPTLEDRDAGPLRPKLSLISIFPAAAIALPAVFFTWVQIRTALNIPYLDDYSALLDFTSEMERRSTFWTKISWLLASQHNEYKLLFLHTIAWFQFSLLGHLDLKALCLAGDVFVLLLATLLWKMFLPNCNDLALRLAYFVPASWLLFQLQYNETLNWAMAGLTNLPILFFSFGAIYFLLRPTKLSFPAAIACFGLAIASSANGFLLLPIGLLILLTKRRFADAAIWFVAFLAGFAVYAYRYTPQATEPSSNHSIFASLSRMNPLYTLSFLGNTASFPLPSTILGSLICLFLLWMAWRGYIKRNPLISCCILFVLLTSIGVAGIRTNFGANQFMTSRYTIYSALMLILIWFIVVEEFLLHTKRPNLSNDIYIGAVAVSVLFSLFMDGSGLIHIQSHNKSLVDGMRAFFTPGSSTGPYAFDPLASPQPTEYQVFARRTLQESIRSGIYSPPAGLDEQGSTIEKR